MNRQRISSVRASSLKRLKEQREFKIPKVSMAEKREQKYMEKFGYTVKQISKKCQSGCRMGTPAIVKGNSARAIEKYLKKDEVKPQHYTIPTIGTVLENVF